MSPACRRSFHALRAVCKSTVPGSTNCRSCSAWRLATTTRQQQADHQPIKDQPHLAELEQNGDVSCPTPSGERLPRQGAAAERAIRVPWRVVPKEGRL